MIKIGIYGYRGYIGSRIKRRLEALNYDVILFNRDEIYDRNFYLVAKDVSYIFLVSGISIIKPWTKRNKQRIYDSRIRPALRFQELIREGLINPEAVIAASAIGIYDENHVHHDGSVYFNQHFLGRLVEDWENSLGELPSTRIVHVRIGNIIGKNSAFFKPMKMLRRLRIKLFFGSGNQEISYIHIDDLISIFIFCMKERDVSGPVNGVNGDIISMQKFMDTLFQCKEKRLCTFHVPVFMMKFFMGERSTLLLDSKKVLPKKLFNRQFTFRFPDIKTCIEDSLKS